MYEMDVFALPFENFFSTSNSILFSLLLSIYLPIIGTGFCCPSNGNRGILISTQNGSKTYRFLVPDDANAPTIESLLKEGLFDTATTPAVSVTHHPVIPEQMDEEQDEEKEEVEVGGIFGDYPGKSSKFDDIKRHRKSQSRRVSVEHRMRAAEQLNSLKAMRWLTVNVSIDNLHLDVMSGYNGMNLETDLDTVTGHLGTLVAKSLRVVSHKCTLGDDVNCTGLDTTVSLQSVHIVRTNSENDESRMRCLEINGVSESIPALTLKYGKRILPYTNRSSSSSGRMARSSERSDSVDSEDREISREQVTTAIGIQTYTRNTSGFSSSSTKTTGMRLMDPSGGLSTTSDENRSMSLDSCDFPISENESSVNIIKTTSGGSLDTLVGMSVDIGIASIYVTKETLNIYDWYVSFSLYFSFSRSLSLYLFSLYHQVHVPQ